MSKRKMHHLYLHIVRAIITFAPFIYLFVCLGVQMFSFGDNGFNWSSDMSNFGINNDWYTNFNAVLTPMTSSRVVYTIKIAYSKIMVDILGFGASSQVTAFVINNLAIITCSQIVYFVYWVFDFFIDFVMDLGERFMNRGNK